MSIVAEAYGSMMVLSVDPALSRAESEEFRRLAAEQTKAGGRWFVLDLSRAGAMDSQGLEDLLWFQDEVQRAGGTVKVAGLKGHPRQIFELVRFDKKFEVFDNVHEAVKSLR